MKTSVHTLNEPLSRDGFIHPRFRALIENSHDDIILLDGEGRLHYVSPPVERILGYTPAQLLGKKTGEYIHPDDWPAVHETISGLLQNYGESIEIVYRARHRNGDWRWITATVTNLLHEPILHSIVFNFRDTTQQVIGQQSLAYSEELYRSLFDNSPFPIFVASRKDLHYIEVNKMALSQYGYTREEFLQMTALDLRSSNNRDDLDRIIREQKCENFRNKVRRHLRKNGETIFVELAVHPIRYRDVDAYLIIAKDLSGTLQLQHALMKEKVNKQIEITKATIQGQEKQREEMGKELHDNVNQMLATVKLYLAAYHTGGHRNDELLERSRAIVDDSISEIRKISQSLVPPSLGELTLKDSLRNLVGPVHLAGMHVRTCFGTLQEDELPDDFKISLYRIVQEQLNNIVKHSKATNVIVSLQQHEHGLDLKIADNGVGFNKAERKAGIGLSNIMNRANLFRGKIRIESEPGMGTRLFLHFNLKSL